MVDVALPIVTITGVSGFIGSQVCLEFLKSQQYKVRGTVRDNQNQTKIEPLRKAFGLHFEQLELVNADLLDEESLIKAIAGSIYVVHTASPFYFSDNEEELVKPAIHGNLAVMKACLAARVKRCVLTSSLVAIAFPAAKNRPDVETGIFDETYWSDPDRPEGLSAYAKGKTLAEKAAWQFQQSLPEQERFEIVSINPTFVMGPSLIPGGFTSADYIVKWFKNQDQEISKSQTGIIDVRDVAKMHFLALSIPEAANKRFIGICQQQKLWHREIVQFLSDEYSLKGVIFSNKEAQTSPAKEASFSNDKAKKIFQMEFIPAKDAIIAMANSLIQHGVIKLPERP